MFNSHIHTEYSHDCTTPVEEMCRAAIEKGFSGIAITDHCNADTCISDNAYRKILKSGEEARRLNQKYNGVLSVMAGVEMSDVLRKPDYAKRLIKALQPDCVIMSVHNIMRKNPTEHLSRMDFGSMDEGEIDSVIKVYFSELLRAAKETDYDICAHLTLPFRYINGKYGKKADVSKCMPEIKKVLSVLIDRNKALEINTSNFSGSLRDFMPSENIVALYREMGGKLVTIGTDAHIPENIDSGFSDGIAMLKRLGFTSYFYYKNRRAVAITL